ncbi:hypothetical protein HDU98_003100, partial [Podochytrium sp. JEL0797]
FNARIKVLNYAPGPMATEMNKKLREELPNPALREGFKNMFEKDQLVDPIDSATVLAKIIVAGKYESGAHLDYYDVKDEYHV